MLLSAQTLATIRRIVGTALTQSCTIEQETTTRGKAGEPKRDWAIVAEGVDCRLLKSGQQTGAATHEAASAESLQYEYRLIVARSVTLGVDMRVTVDGIAYNVVRIEDALGDEAFHSAILHRRGSR